MATQGLKTLDAVRNRAATFRRTMMTAAAAHRSHLTPDQWAKLIAAIEAFIIQLISVWSAGLNPPDSGSDDKPALVPGQPSRNGDKV